RRDRRSRRSRRHPLCRLHGHFGLRPPLQRESDEHLDWWRRQQFYAYRNELECWQLLVDDASPKRNGKRHGNEATADFQPCQRQRAVSNQHHEHAQQSIGAWVAFCGGFLRQPF
ncbi:MAG: hypothetical protein N2035_10515, partial [Chthoniobacterales bacterium]|nr:hypothetical protein [Chthoniobacterales bacterium]